MRQVWGLVESHLILKVLFTKKYNFTFKRRTPQVAVESALEHAAAPRDTPTTPWKEPQLFSFVVVDRNRECKFGATRRRRCKKKLRHRCRTDYKEVKDDNGVKSTSTNFSLKEISFNGVVFLSILFCFLPAAPPSMNIFDGFS